MHSFKPAARRHGRIPRFLFLSLLILSCWSIRPAQATGIGNGQIITSSITGTGTATWTFYAQSGNQGYLAALNQAGGTYDGEFFPKIVINNPDGTENTEAKSDVNGVRTDQWTLPQTGLYSITVSNWIGSSYPTHVANFTLEVAVTVPVPSAPNSGGGGAMFPGVINNGAVGGSNADIWTFPANTGDPTVIVMTDPPALPNFRPAITLFGPDGSIQAAAVAVDGITATIRYTATATGTYTVLATNYYGETNPAVPSLAYTINVTGTTVLPTIPKTQGTRCLTCEAMATGGKAVGDPINVATGNLVEQVTDYTTVGANPLAFIRTYNSLSVQDNLYPT